MTVDPIENLPAGCNYKDKVAQDPVPVLLDAAVLLRIAEDEADDVRAFAFIIL